MQNLKKQVNSAKTDTATDAKENNNLHQHDIRLKSNFSTQRPGSVCPRSLPLELNFYKTNYGVHYGTWVDPHINQPYFNNRSDVVFKIGSNDQKGSFVSNFQKIVISSDSIRRLSAETRKHRVIREKFLQTESDQPNNFKMTFEDNFNKKQFDAVFKNSLRPHSSFEPLKQKGQVGKPDKLNKDGEEKQQEKQKILTSQPPQFYEDDMNYWLQKKFQPAIEKRKKEKEIQQKNGRSYSLGTANHNIRDKYLPKRRNSRMSAPTFNSLDFECNGNTADVNHLIQKQNQSSTLLSFFLNLRNYKAQQAPLMDKPFAVIQHDTQRQIQDPVGLSKGQFQVMKGGQLKAVPYVHDYTEKNMNNVRSLFDLNSKMQKPLLQWEVSLRDSLKVKIQKKNPQIKQ